MRLKYSNCGDVAVVGRQSIVGEAKWELEGFRGLGSEENVLLVILRGWSVDICMANSEGR